MGCTGSTKRTELEFLQELSRLSLGGCCGPLVVLPLVAYRLDVLEASFFSDAARDLLWGGYIPTRSDDRLLFRLCTAHWMDLSGLAGKNAYGCRRQDWLGEAITLLKQICQAAGWDPKEIANLRVWQRVATVKNRANPA